MEQKKIKEKDWMPLSQEEKIRQSDKGRSVGYWCDVRRRFMENKLSVTGLIIIVLIIIVSIFGPMLTGKTYEDQELGLRNMPPRIKLYIADDGTQFYIQSDLKLYLVNEKDYVSEELKPVSGNLAEKKFKYEYQGKEYFLVFGEKTQLLDHNEQPIDHTRTVWNKNYLLGTDSLGRDLLTRLLYGGRVSLIVAFIVTFCTLIIGVLYGGISGYYGGNVDVVMMRVVEVLMSIPSTIYVILLMIYFGQGIINILIAMAATSWLGMARLVRGQVMSLKEYEFVLAAKGAGASPFRIIVTHLLPNCIGPIIVSATLAIPGAIATEAFMSFIGLGVAPPMPSWGILSNEGIGAIRSAPYQILLPSIAISLTMFAFNFLGDGLRDALDPRLRK